MGVLNSLATVVAFVLEQIHRGLSTFLPDGSGWAWGLSIVFLTMTVRILLFPIFVKQIKSQRRMQELAPKVKALQAKHKGDRETLNTEMMKLYKEHGTNPISGCMPMLLQLPIFFALFRVMNEFRPRFDSSGNFHFNPKYGLSRDLITQGAHAKVFGAPISAAFTSGPKLLTALHGDSTTVKIVSALMIVIMGGTTFWTQRQLMARTGGQLDPQQAQVQKIMLYVLPFSFAIFGFSFPIGVLLYWLTTNLWSMGQQRFVIARMPPVGTPAHAAKEARDASKGKRKGEDVIDGTVVSDEEAATEAETPDAAKPVPNPPRPVPNRAAAGSRKNKKKKRR